MKFLDINIGYLAQQCFIIYKYSNYNNSNSCSYKAFVRRTCMVVVCVTYAAYTGLCCLFSGYCLRISVLLFNFVFCVENRVFAESVFVVEVFVCLFVLRALARVVFQVNVTSMLATELNMRTDRETSISARVMPTCTSHFSQYITGLN
jgi:uncharacterized membrane protein